MVMIMLMTIVISMINYGGGICKQIMIIVMTEITWSMKHG